MRLYLLGLCVLASACSKAPEGGERGGSFDVAEPASASPDGSGPGVNITAAPGVAFNYRYAFRLPAGNIDKAQETHAQACEKLGVSRCRITGMRYTIDRDNQVAAAISFKLDPALARRFGREGIAAIQRAEGMLIEAEITGTDAGAEIERLDSNKSALADERARIDRELARPGLTASARTELLRQRASLDQETRSADSAKSEQQASLARTPVSFNYESGRAIRGFDPRSPFADAADNAIASMQWTLAFALSAIALLGPPALLLVLLFLLWQRVSPLLPRRRRKEIAAD